MAIKVSDLFDLNNINQLKEAEKFIKNIDKVYSKMAKDIEANSKNIKASLDLIAKSTSQLKSSVDTLRPSQEAEQKQIVETNAKLKTLSSTQNTLISNLTKLQSSQEKVNAERREVNRLAKENQKLQAKVAQATSKEALDNEKLKQRLNQLNAERRKTAKEALGQISLYQKESARLNELAKRYQELSLRYGQNSKQARKVKVEHDKLRTSLVNIDTSLGRGYRNIGRYNTALKGMATNLLAAFGFAGLIFGFARAIQNAFRAVRDFDKEMTNMAAIVGKNRGDLKFLEDEIREVAATSLNTANEVAKLATALFTLGQSEQDVKKLLAPVNSLSIALQAPADQAGELLIQTLNAFGESSDAAEEYADIIAKMRTSTALDFERIKDALGFLAPTAKAVGLDFAETGAILGVLVDNGIKAARAGRLMSSSFARLNQLGLTLNEAISKINNSTDKTKTATELFGTESFTLGLILADNTRKTNEYAESFRDASGALEELTEKQLESMDSKLKILGSTWQEFILSIENGSGTFGTAIVTMIDWLTRLVTFITPDKFSNDFLEGVDYGSGLEIQNDKLGEEIKKFDDLSKLLNRQMNEQKKILQDPDTTALGGKEAAKRIEELKSQYEKTLGILSSLYKRQKDLGESTGDNITNNQELTKSQEKLIFLYRKQVDSSRDLKTALTKEEIDTLAKAYNKWRQEVDGLNFSTEEATDTAEYFAKRNQDLADAANTAADALDKMDDSIDYQDQIDDIIEQTKVTDESAEAMENASKQADGWRGSLGRLASQLLGFGKTAAEMVIAAANAITGVWSLINQLFDDAAERRIQAREVEIEGLEENRDKELEILNQKREDDLISDDAYKKLKAAQEEQYNKKIQRLEEQNRRDKTRAAKREKAVRIAQGIIDTAAAVIEALPNIPLSIAVGAAGALQVAAIASTPVPAFEKGTDNAPGGIALVGEKGRELVREPSGKTYLTGDKAELRDIPKGSQILTNAITERMLRDTMSGHERGGQDVKDRVEYDRKMLPQAIWKAAMTSNSILSEEFAKTVSKLPIHQIYLKRGDFQKNVKVGQTTHKEVINENRYG